MQRAASVPVQKRRFNITSSGKKCIQTMLMPLRHLNGLVIAMFMFITKKCCIALSTNKFQTKSGLPVSKYGLGGAARSIQPSTLPEFYCDLLKKSSTGKGDNNSPDSAAPFFFYYNPHRYPLFLSGVSDVIDNIEKREDVFVASGGTDRSIQDLDQRLQDALQYCGGDYLDMFVLEYVCPEELAVIVDDDRDSHPTDPTQRLEAGNELQIAIDHVRENWMDGKNDGSIRYLAISTHSHVAGTVLSRHEGVDALMLRYGMSHKDAAENLSFPAAVANNKPVIAFTSTRWNSLQEGHPASAITPTSTDCLAFSLAASPPVETLLHSARDEDELQESLGGLLATTNKHPHSLLTTDDIEQWRAYGSLFEEANTDYFDEYPEERFLKSSN